MGTYWKRKLAGPAVNLLNQSLKVGSSHPLFAFKILFISEESAIEHEQREGQKNRP